LTGLRAFSVPFLVNKRIVRGLDYYNRTTFEIYPPCEDGAQSVLGAGGRYVDIFETMGGPSIPGVGFALGIERLADLALKDRKGVTLRSLGPRIAVLAKEGAKEESICEILSRLWKARIPAMPLWGSQGLRAKLRFVGKRGFSYALMIPPEADSLILKDMERGVQHEGPSFDIAWIKPVLRTMET
jgi:histidyl-tRNA synthetase